MKFKNFEWTLSCEKIIKNEFGVEMINNLTKIYQNISKSLNSKSSIKFLKSNSIFLKRIYQFSYIQIQIFLKFNI